MNKIILNIEGMTCSACSNGLEKYLNKQERNRKRICKSSYGNRIYRISRQFKCKRLRKICGRCRF